MQNKLSPGKRNKKSSPLQRKTKNSRSSNIPSISNEHLALEEYLKCLKNALQESFVENDLLRKQIECLEKERREVKTLIHERVEAIEELARYYTICQSKHKGKKFMSKIKTRSSKSKIMA